MNRLRCYWLTIAENIFRHGSGRDCFVGVMDVVNVRNIGNVGDVGYVSYVGDVNRSQVVGAVVIPGEERFSRAQRKPTY
jgi:hypothetical protein